MTEKRLSSNILPQMLGELELEILQILWRTPGLSAKEITQSQSTSRKISLSTVQSSLESLRKKELVTFSKTRQSFIYQASVSRPELLSKYVCDIVHNLHDGKLDTILSSFVHFAENISDHALDNLEQLIRERRNNKNETNRD